jgi:hypothetical protein
MGLNLQTGLPGPSGQFVPGPGSSSEWHYQGPWQQFHPGETTGIQVPATYGPPYGLPPGSMGVGMSPQVYAPYFPPISHFYPTVGYS